MSSFALTIRGHHHAIPQVSLIVYQSLTLRGITSVPCFQVIVQHGGDVDEIMESLKETDGRVSLDQWNEFLKTIKMQQGEQ